MKWPHDDTHSKNAFYGDFHGKAWASLNLVHITAPFQMYYVKGPVPSILVHRKIAPALMLVFDEVWEHCQHDQKNVDATGASDYGGCFNIRPIAGHPDSWSNHSWACAIDLSPSTNGFRHDASTTLSSIVIDSFKRQGALWGGDYHGRKDPMHFEFVSR